MTFFKLNVVSLAERSGSGQTSDLTFLNGNEARFLLAVTDVSGTAPTLDVVIEGKTLSGNYVAVAHLPQATDTAGRTVHVLALMSPYRISWNISGASASFTFEIDVMTAN